MVPYYPRGGGGGGCFYYDQKKRKQCIGGGGGGGGGGEVDLNAIMKQGNIYYKKKRESEENAKMLFGRKIEASFVIIYIRKMLVEV